MKFRIGHLTLAYYALLIIFLATAAYMRYREDDRSTASAIIGALIFLGFGLSSHRQDKISRDIEAVRKIVEGKD